MAIKLPGDIPRGSIWNSKIECLDLYKDMVRYIYQKDKVTLTDIQIIVAPCEFGGDKYNSGDILLIFDDELKREVKGVIVQGNHSGFKATYLLTEMVVYEIPDCIYTSLSFKSKRAEGGGKLMAAREELSKLNLDGDMNYIGWIQFIDYLVKEYNLGDTNYDTERKEKNKELMSALNREKQRVSATVPFKAFDPNTGESKVLNTEIFLN